MQPYPELRLLSRKGAAATTPTLTLSLAAAASTYSTITVLYAVPFIAQKEQDPLRQVLKGQNQCLLAGAAAFFGTSSSLAATASTHYTLDTFRWALSKPQSLKGPIHQLLLLLLLLLLVLLQLLQVLLLLT